MLQEGGKRRSSKKASKKSSRRSVSKKASKKSKKSKKSSRRSVSKKASKKSKKSSRRVSSKKASKKSKKSSRRASKKVSKKAKGSKKARREANPQITVRGALVKYVWSNLDVKKVAADKGMNQIGVPAKIVQMAMVEAQKTHPVTEANKKNPAFWEGVKKTAMKLLADNLQKYAGAVKK
jgi:hypothetical protein